MSAAALEIENGKQTIFLMAHASCLLLVHSTPRLFWNERVPKPNCAICVVVSRYSRGLWKAQPSPVQRVRLRVLSAFYHDGSFKTERTP